MRRVASYTIVAKRLDGWRCHSAKGAQHLPPLLGPCRLWPRSPISATAELLFQHGRQDLNMQRVKVNQVLDQEWRLVSFLIDRSIFIE